MCTKRESRRVEYDVITIKYCPSKDDTKVTPRRQEEDGTRSRREGNGDTHHICLLEPLRAGDRVPYRHRVLHLVLWRRESVYVVDETE
jgi:hypothetical protein